MERSISFQMGVVERQSSLQIRVVDKQKSFTKELIEDEQGLREKKIESNAQKRGDTPLHLAVRADNLTQVKELLLDLKINGSTESIWKENNDGHTALYIAAENGNVRIVREILKVAHMQSAATKVDRSCDAFHIAAKLGHAEVLKEILQSFPELIATTNLSNATALYTAASQGHINVVDLILETDVNVARIVRNNGKTALHIAARMDHLEVVKLLLMKDPAIGLVTDRKGQTALHVAVKGQSVKIVQELLKNAPSIINLADNKGNTPLHAATRKGRLQIIQALLSFPGIHVNASNKAGETALGIAEKYFNEETGAVIREAGGSATKGKEEIEEIEEIQIEDDPSLPPSTPNKLKQAVSFLRQEVKFQLRWSRRTQLGVDKLKKKMAKMINNGLNKANNSNIVVATLIFSSAFGAIFQVPGQYTSSDGDGYSLGQAYIANGPAFAIFLLSDCFALFVSLAVVVAQTSLIVVDQKAMKWMIFVINKLMWACCISISVAFVSLAYVVIRQDNWWLAWSTLIMAVMILISTLGIMSYCIISHWVHQKKLKHSIKRAVTGIGESYSRCATLVSDALLKAECKKMRKGNNINSYCW